MARSLEQSRGELESQNTELEMQAIALEERQEELTEAGDETRAQRDELEHTAAQLAAEKARAERYGEFADRLAALARRRRCWRRSRWRRWPRRPAPTSACSTRETGATRRRWARAAVARRSIRRRWPSTRSPGERARARGRWRRARWSLVDGAGAGLRVRTGLGGEARRALGAARAAAHGERAVGVATLGGVSAAAFDAAESPTLPRLAGQAAVALAEAGALAQRNWLSQVNAAVLDCVREGIALVGLDHELVFANAAMEQLAARLSMPIPAAIGASGATCDGARWATPRPTSPSWEAMLADTDEPTADELRSPAWCSSATRRRSTTRRARGSAGSSCCATSPASARSTSSSPT